MAPWTGREQSPTLTVLGSPERVEVGLKGFSLKLLSVLDTSVTRLLADFEGQM